MKSTRIWLGRGVNNHSGLIEWIRSSSVATKWTILASHTNPNYHCASSADEFWIEQSNPTSEQYLQACLKSCKEQLVDIFIPGRDFVILDSARSEFEKLGTKLMIPATGKLLETIENKEDFYSSIASISASGPVFQSYETISGFETAYADMIGQFRRVCTKPSVAIFAQGFRVIHPEIDPYHDWLSPSIFRISLDDMRRVWRSRESFPTQLLMEYLAGEEWSVDCFRSLTNELIAIPRHKCDEGYQEIISNDEISRAVQEIAEKFDLHGLFNIQFKYHEGSLRTLEVNPRLSGGVGMARFTGINLPALAIAETLGLDYSQEHTITPVRINKTDYYFKVKS